jgi:uncharacterized protein YhbP (UPF0306 family)
MPSEVLKYIRQKKVCVLALRMPDGSPHAATVHFAYDERQSIFIIMTNPNYRKYAALAAGPAQASLVVGSEEDAAQTLQLDGTAQLSNDAILKQLYADRFPGAIEKHNKDVLFTFTPNWWRFSDYTNGKSIISSENK